jgi:hypothetical protein
MMIVISTSLVVVASLIGGKLAKVETADSRQSEAPG